MAEVAQAEYSNVLRLEVCLLRRFVNDSFRVNGPRSARPRSILLDPRHATLSENGPASVRRSGDLSANP